MRLVLRGRTHGLHCRQVPFRASSCCRLLSLPLPILRRRNYNAFYFTHVIFAAAIIILTCLHASTNFYFCLPGLLLWIADWVWRVRNALGSKVEVLVENAGDGWYRIRLPHRKGPELESGQEFHNPLATYYVNFAAVSRLQIHPFTAASIGHGHEKTGPLLLFRRGPERKKIQKRDSEWTWKLGDLVDAAHDGNQTPFNVCTPLKETFTDTEALTESTRLVLKDRTPHPFLSYTQPTMCLLSWEARA